MTTVASTTPAANRVPKALGTGKLAAGWLTAAAILADLGLGAGAAGDLIYGSAANTVARLAIAPAGQVLTSTGTAPAWSGTGLTYASGVLTVAQSNGRLLIQNGTAAAQMRISCFDAAGSANGTIQFEGFSQAYGAWNATGMAIGATALASSERLRIAGGTAPGTPGATDVLVGAGQIKAGASITCTTLTASGKFIISGNGSSPTSSALEIGTNAAGTRWQYNAPTGGEHNFLINGSIIAYVSGSGFGVLSGTTSLQATTCTTLTASGGATINGATQATATIKTTAGGSYGPACVFDATAISSGKSFSISATGGSDAIAPLGSLAFYDITGAATRGYISSAGSWVFGPTDPGGGAMVRVSGGVSCTTLTASAGIFVSGGTATAGSIVTTASNGLQIRGLAGSSSDFTIVNPSGSNVIAYVPTGTQQWTVLGKLSANGAAASSTLTGFTVAQLITWIQTWFA